MPFARITAMWRSHRRKSAELRAARRALDLLFTDKARLLPQARLEPKHRGRAVVLEIEVDDDLEASRVLFGIVRHPKSHPMQPRGEAGDWLEMPPLPRAGVRRRSPRPGWKGRA